ncbi:MAG: nuclear transport factor 2 family protein [Thaumarchaeota archaeon]|nr:nuclear transport factor 2 family protein [Nitrososphaerota archaeon]
MADQLAEAARRIRELEDLDAVSSVILGFETMRDGRPETADNLLKFVMPDIRFYWSLEDIELKGSQELIAYLQEGMTPRIWCRHAVANIQVKVKGDRAEATWYVMAESVSRPDPKRAGKGDKRARQREPASLDTLIHSDTKGAKHATLVRTADGWKFSDYQTDMARISVSHVKVG